LEVSALEALHDLEVSATQRTALAKLAHESAPEAESRQPAKASAAVAKALTDLHAAYAKGDELRIEGCRTKLDDLMQTEEVELDSAITITEGARSNAADALQLLNVRQTGAFLATLEVTDPAEFLSSAVETVRTIKDAKERDEEIATVAEEVGWLLHGDDDAAAKPTREKVTKLLQRVAGLRNDAAVRSQQKATDKEIRDLVAGVDNLDVIAHILEHGMAELLSNPRLEAALRIQARVPTASSSAGRSTSKTTKGKSSR
jgi:hypothetical protein